MKDRIFTNGTEYTLLGDYYIPNIALPEENRPIGRWGRMHRDYLKEHRPILFNDLILSGQLWTYLADLNEQAQERLSLIVEQMKASEGVTEEFWYGNIEPTEYDTSSCKEYKKLVELICRNEEKLQATMTDEQKELFEKYTDCVREHQTSTDCLIFQNGLRLGARMMLEVIEE